MTPPLAGTAAILLSLMLGGCGGAPPADDSAADRMPAADSGGTAYPPLYRELSLPELPGGTVTSTGRQTTSLRDGLAIRVSTPMPVADARDYYSSALAEQGWEESPSRSVPGAPMAGLRATKDGVTYMVTIVAMGDATQVDINVHD